MDPLKIVIPTNSLKSLLKDHPEIEAKLEALACEKIAEEIMRKIDHRKVTMLKSVETKVDEIIEARVKALGSRYRLPVEAKSVIREAVDEEVKDEKRRAMLDLSEHTKRLKADLVAGTAQVVHDMEAAVASKLSKRIADQARAEFFEVLKEARSSGQG